MSATSTPFISKPKAKPTRPAAFLAPPPPATTVKKVPLSRKPLCPSRKLNSTTVDLNLDETTLTQCNEDFLNLDEVKKYKLLLLDQVIEENLEEKERDVDIQLSALALRFESNMATLQKYEKRLKEISFAAERKKLLDMRTKDIDKIFESTNEGFEGVIAELTRKQQSSLDRVELKNIDLDYSEEAGHRKLLETIDAAIKDFEHIKKSSNIDTDLLQDYARSVSKIDNIDSRMAELSNFKREFDSMFPKVNEKVLIGNSKHLECIGKNLVDSDDE